MASKAAGRTAGPACLIIACRCVILSGAVDQPWDVWVSTDEAIGAV